MPNSNGNPAKDVIACFVVVSLYPSRFFSNMKCPRSQIDPCFGGILFLLALHCPAQTLPLILRLTTASARPECRAVLSSRLRRSESHRKTPSFGRFYRTRFLGLFFHHFGENAIVGLQSLPDLLGLIGASGMSRDKELCAGQAGNAPNEQSVPAAVEKAGAGLGVVFE